MEEVQEETKPKNKMGGRSTSLKNGRDEETEFDVPDEKAALLIKRGKVCVFCSEWRERRRQLFLSQADFMYGHHPTFLRGWSLAVMLEIKGFLFRLVEVRYKTLSPYSNNQQALPSQP